MKSEELDDLMDDVDEEFETKQALKMPDDLEGEDDDEVDYDNEIDEEEGEDELDEPNKQQEVDDDIENEVFAMARENHEMKNPKLFANQEMVEKISKIEDEMMDDKKWTLKGEVQ